MFTVDNLRHHMPIKHVISMFEQKIAKDVEEIVLLTGNLPEDREMHIWTETSYQCCEIRTS